MTVAMHLHSHYSDGKDSVEEICQELKKVRARAGTLCDHDTTRGTRQFLSLTKEAAIESITGVEISTCHKGKYYVHLLALGYDPGMIELIEAALQKNCDAHNSCFQESISEVNKALGLDLTTEHIRKVTNRGGKANFTLPLYKYLEGMGYPLADFKKAIFGENSPLKRLLTSGNLMTAEEGMKFIRDIGATPFFAHPGLFARYSLDGKSTKQELEETFRHLIDLGLQGAEYYYPYPNNDESVNYYADISRSLIEEHGLRRLSGSDCHGAFKMNYCGIAMPGVTFPEFMELKAFCER